MRAKSMAAVVLLTILGPLIAIAQRSCPDGIQVEGLVTDPSGAVIPGASISVLPNLEVTSDPRGHYVLLCVPGGAITLRAHAQGFQPKSINLATTPGRSLHVDLRLSLAVVESEVLVNGESTGIDSGRGPGTTVLDTRQIQQLADDPDDFLRELQALASNGAGSSQPAVIMVDGFRNTSVMPPKSAIGSIRIHPDDFLAEYDGPTWFRGRLEITTKSGADAFHGALFFTDSDGSFNATDPFSLTSTPATKRRYGFELSGPLVNKKNGFSLALEKRDINEFRVVNAITLDSQGTESPFQQSLSAPQRLWIASARSDWQFNPKDQMTLSFSANVNNLSNQGVGGLTLPEAGYASLANEYDLRYTNTYTINANLLHSTRIGYTWKRTQDTPSSNAPSLGISGAFIGGGTTAQNLNTRERDLEIDDDLMGTRGRHSWKIGAQSIGVFLHNYDPNTFNGAFVFGGGKAPELDAVNNPTGQTITLTPIQQYQRTLLKLPGGTPTTYQVTSGTPLVAFAQWRLALFAEDTIKLRSNLVVAPGLRYQLQTSPSSYGSIGPRLGISWAPDSKQSWVFHLHGGLFRGVVDPSSVSNEAYRLDGVRQRQVTVYSPSFNDPLNPIAGSIQVSTVNKLSPTLAPNFWYQLRVGVEHEFRHNWHPEAAYYWGGDWGDIQMRNVNAPLVASSVGMAADPSTALLSPRPVAPNENIIQFQNSGHLSGGYLYLALNQYGFKRFGLHAGYIRMNVKCNGCVGYAPQQSSYSSAGESSRPDWLSRDSFNFIGNVNLPFRLGLSTAFDASSGKPYNITTGTDNNGDGNFNDRPSYTTASGSGVFTTRFGRLTTNTVNGNVPRNLGTMPSTLHLDLNLSRSFRLKPKDTTHSRVLTLNARSGNVINRTNVTAVGTVVSSSNFGDPVSAEPARRIELGARISF